MLRIGIGFDVHRTAPGLPLVLGGVRVPCEFGLAGHSDADVLCHAVIDALLGALGRGDIGQWFPDRDPAYANADSIDLLATVLAADGIRDWEIVNLDAVVIAEQPRLAPFIPAMRDRLARCLQTEPARISVKATTSEGLGFTGRGEGIAAQAVVLLQQAAQR